ncbi:MAG: regulatory protein [Betaproteobacteria bacterium]|nr:MAG: regulatory protein [Betaproteobacteria bacterium]
MAQYAKSGQYATLAVAIGWTARRAGREHALDERLPRLLAAVARTGTLIAAARAAGIPYRSAWAVLEASARDVGAPLAELARGRGATLTPAGERLLAAHESALAAAKRFETVEVRVEPRARRAEAPPPLRIAASHDIALAQLRDRWRLAHGIQLEFHGSAESLDAYRAGSVDVAGFHVELGARRDSDPLLGRLDPGRDALLSFLTRSQGLIVPKGNPRKVRTLAHVVQRGLAIVNRQPGSGTRLLLDRLLSREGLDAAAVRGYTQEEFTHAAVAATVAAGRADAGLGIQAAAAQFGLSFVPLVRERYCFATRRSGLRAPRIVAFRALLAGDATRAVVAPLPGYALDRPGALVA